MLLVFHVVVLQIHRVLSGLGLQRPYVIFRYGLLYVEAKVLFHPYLQL